MGVSIDTCTFFLGRDIWPRLRGCGSQAELPVTFPLPSGCFLRLPVAFTKVFDLIIDRRLSDVAEPFVFVRVIARSVHVSLRAELRPPLQGLTFPILP